MLLSLMHTLVLKGLHRRCKSVQGCAYFLAEIDVNMFAGTAYVEYVALSTGSC
jgi:hypothetical protein